MERRQSNVCAAVLAACLLGVVAPALRAQDSIPRDRVVRGLSFDGNRSIDDYTLGISIATSRSALGQRIPLVRMLGLGQVRYFDETEFRRDVLRIALLYRQSGFFEAKVDTFVTRAGANVWVRFRVTEGAPVRVASVAVEGVEDIPRSQDLKADLPLAPGEPFSRFRFLSSADTIRVRLQNRGYPYADVYRNYDEDRAQRAATVRYAVVPGPRVRLGTIEVMGNERVAAYVVRRAAGLVPGDLYRGNEVARSQIDLYRSALFTHVTVGLADSLSVPAPGDTLAELRIEVAEGKFHQARAGAGFGALDCFRGIVGWTARDFLGGGRTLDLTGKLSKIGGGGVCTFGNDDPERLKLNYSATAVLRQPSLIGHRTSGALSLFSERRSEIRTYVRTAQGGELSLSNEVAWQTSLTLTYGLSFGRTVADPAIFCSVQNLCRSEDTLFNRPRRESALGAQLIWDGSNSPLDPSRGAVFSLQGRYAAPAIGSDSLSQFLKGVVEFSSYHRLGRSGVFAWRMRFGGIAPTEFGFTARSAKFVPPDERLYAGGPNSVRGYGQNELGPLVRVRQLDGTLRTAPTGGTRLVLLNAEMRAPLPLFAGSLTGAAFIDAGQVFDPDRAVAERRLRFTPGIGLRIGTPLGPVRFDVAYRPYEQTLGPLYTATADGQLIQEPVAFAPPSPGFWDHVKFNFSVGQAF